MSIKSAGNTFLVEEDPSRKYVEIGAPQHRESDEFMFFDNHVATALPALIQSLNGSYSLTEKQINFGWSSDFPPKSKLANLLTFVFRKDLAYLITPYIIEKKASSFTLCDQVKKQDYRLIQIKGSSKKPVRLPLSIFKEHAGEVLNDRLNLYKQIRKLQGKKAKSRLDLSADLLRKLLIIFGEYLHLEGSAFEKALTEKLSNKELNIEDLSSLFQFAFKYDIKPLMQVCLNVFSLFAEKEHIKMIADLATTYKNEKLTKIVEHLQSKKESRKST